MKRASFGRFSDTIIEYAAHIFSPMYAQVFRHYWHTSSYDRMKRSYYYSSWKEGRLEVYIPTFMDLERNMCYHRIVLQTLPGLDPWIRDEEAEKLLHDRRVSHLRTHNWGGPPGRIDSETIILIAPKLSPRGLALHRQDQARRKQGLKQKKDWVVRDRYLTPSGAVPCIRVCPIINRAPEIIMKNLLKVLRGFYEDRVKKMIRAFNLDHTLSEWRGSFTSTLLYVSHIVEERGLGAIANALRCLTHTWQWIQRKRSQIIEQLAQQSQIMLLIGKIKPYQPLLRKITAKTNPFQFEPNSQLARTLLEVCTIPPPSWRGRS